MSTTLEDLAAALRRIEARLAEPQPMCFKLPDAAARLGVSITTLREMMARGEIRTSTVGRRQMVSLAELERVAAPDEDRPRVERRQRERAWKPLERRPPRPRRPEDRR